LKISKNTKLSIATFLAALLIVLCLAPFLGIQFSDSRFRAGAGLIIPILPWICISIVYVHCPKWLKVLTIFAAVPLALITVGMFCLSLIVDLPTLRTGEDPNSVLIERKKVGSKYRCAYDTNLLVGHAVEEYRYETPILPGIVKIDNIDDIKIDSDKWSVKINRIQPIYEKSDPVLRLNQNESVHEGIPDEKTFEPLLIRVLSSYFEDDRFKNLQFRYMLLADHPFQSGIAFPKYYLWIEKYDGSRFIGQGVMEIAAIDQTRLGVIEFTSKKDLETDREWIKQHYPPEVCQSIFQQINTK